MFCIVLYAEGYFICVLKEFSNSSYYFAAVCIGNPFCFLALRIGVYVLLL
jgi:hypothetical protein